MTDLLWLRRDLRRADLPALGAATENGDVAVLFVVDPQFWDPAGPGPRRWLAANLISLRDTYGGRLTLRRGDPRTVVPQVARELGATRVHVSEETEPAGARRDRDVSSALADFGVQLVRTGSPYAVTPGRVVTREGQPFHVFTPFSRAWRAHGWRAPAADPKRLSLAPDRSDEEVWDLVRAEATSPGPDLPEPGEAGFFRRWSEFLDDGLEAYASGRDLPAAESTSRLSPYLKLGVVHPRTLLADLVVRTGSGCERFVTELAWREFYADVVGHRPDSLWEDLRPNLVCLEYDDSESQAVTAWKEGRTGFPFVDAGMRQLLGSGWMHNRLRMITASFLTKHLHVRWQVGARHFLRHLIDADLASNNHGWQWVAGTGTDAAPYFRIFNPVLQSERFDPNGDYIRRWIPELRQVTAPAVHRPGATGVDEYPEPIIDLAEERDEALRRYSAARSGSSPR